MDLSTFSGLYFQSWTTGLRHCSGCNRACSVSGFHPSVWGWWRAGWQRPWRRLSLGPPGWSAHSTTCWPWRLSFPTLWNNWQSCAPARRGRRPWPTPCSLDRSSSLPGSRAMLYLNPLTQSPVHCPPGSVGRAVAQQRWLDCLMRKDRNPPSRHSWTYEKGCGRLQSALQVADRFLARRVIYPRRRHSQHGGCWSETGGPGWCDGCWRGTST